MKLDPFYPIVDSAAWVERLVGVGARLIQLRVKDRARGRDRCGGARGAGDLRARRRAIDRQRLLARRHRHRRRLHPPGPGGSRRRGYEGDPRQGNPRRDQHSRRGRARARARARPRLCRARPDLSDDPEGDEIRRRRVSSASANGSGGSGQIPLVAIGGLNVERGRPAWPRAPTSSPSSPTSRSTPIPRRARANGSRRRARHERTPDRPDDRRLRLRRRRGRAGGPEDLRRARRLRRQRDHGVHRAEHARRRARSICAAAGNRGRAQIDAVLGDFGVGAVKIGMLGDRRKSSRRSRRRLAGAPSGPSSSTIP